MGETRHAAHTVLSGISKVPPWTNDYHEIAAERSQFNGHFVMTASVVIPFYREPSILARTLASLVRQTYPSHLLEVIVCDDGSSDDLAWVVREYSSRLNLCYLRQKRMGHRVSTARNLGMQHASGDIIISLDFDMICPPHFVASHLTWFHISDRIATIGPRKFVDAQGVSTDDILRDFSSVVALPSVGSISNRMMVDDQRLNVFERFDQHPFPGNCFYACNAAYRRTDALRIGGYDERYNGNPNYEDIDFGHRMWLSGVFLAADLECLAYHQENMVVTLGQRISGGAINRAKLYSRFPDLMRYRRSAGME